MEEDYGITLLPWLAIPKHVPIREQSSETSVEREHGTVIEHSVVSFLTGATSQAATRGIPFTDPEPCRIVRLIYSRKYLESSLISVLDTAILQ